MQEIADWLDKLGLGCGLAMARIALGEPASASFAIRPYAECTAGLGSVRARHGMCHSRITHLRNCHIGRQA